MSEPATDRWTHPAIILVATDLSDMERLMPFAFQQAESTGARLLLLHVLAASEAMAVDAVGMPYYDPSGASESARTALETWCTMAQSRKIACDALIREGYAAQVVLSVARQFRADRILLGTRSRSKMSKLLLGSVAEQVLRSATLPVITVGPEAHLPVVAADAQRVVLHATTLGETSRPSAALACQIAAALDARLVMMHVLPPVDEMARKGLPTGVDSAALKELSVIAEETACDCSISVDPYVVHGNASIEILAESARLQASLIVLGATPRSAFETVTRDRTIYKVLAHARCPVLTMRAPRPEKEEILISRLAAHT
ncbi:MAG TPA: universal stress protein [Terracidiphilus sp.]|jgi:nucleotide-binding universal stress UspA family protein